jgi:hypothetical protein
MTNKSQIKWSAGLRKRDLADDEDQRANLRAYLSLPYLTSTSLRAATEISFEEFQTSLQCRLRPRRNNNPAMHLVQQ